MFFWFIFYGIELLLLLSSYIVTDRKSKQALFSLSAVLAIYFSAFRDGLGSDYKSYYLRMNSEWIWESDSNSEVLFTIIRKLIEHTILSPVFYFAICAFITIWLFWKYFDDKRNPFPAISILIFLSIPGMYFNTFNVVRQFFSAAIFFQSIKYIKSNKIIPYSILIALASIMHTSAIILWPLYFLLNRHFSIKFYCIVTVVLFFIAFSLSPILESITFLSDKYSLYLNTEEEAGNSSFTIACCIILILYLIKTYKRRTNLNTSPYMVITTNLFFLYVIFSLLTFVSFYFYRVTYYFIASVCVMFPYVINEILKSKQKTKAICISFSFIYFFLFIISSHNNPEICPDKILSIVSIFD